MSMFAATAPTTRPLSSRIAALETTMVPRVPLKRSMSMTASRMARPSFRDTRHGPLLRRDRLTGIRPRTLVALVVDTAVQMGIAAPGSFPLVILDEQPAILVHHDEAGRNRVDDRSQPDAFGLQLAPGLGTFDGIADTVGGILRNRCIGACPETRSGTMQVQDRL